MSVWSPRSTFPALAFALACGGERDASGPPPGPDCGTPEGGLDALPEPLEVGRHRAPGLVYFSPRGADLDGDGKPEIIAAGGTEIPPSGEVIVLDGESLAVRFRASAQKQLYGSAAFVDVTGDGVLDVFVGGRNEEFLALDGASGALLWRFVDDRSTLEYYFYNFYTAVVIDDRTGDGIADLLVANGGADGIEPFAPRPPGHLAVLDSVTGSVVGAAYTPDLEETYMSPLIVPDAGTSSPTILFGTGGETRWGGLWKTTLDDVLAGDISGAELLVEVQGKGVIAPPSLGDFDGDGRLDVVVATFDGRLIALKSATSDVLWELAFDGFETYSTPTLGYFDEDDVPDVFGVFLHGEFPFYDRVERVLVSGRDGSVIWQEAHGTFAMAGDLAVDLDGDGSDEVIFSSSDQNAEPALQHSLHLLDGAGRRARPWGAPLGAASQSSPWAGDLDGDGCLELVVVQNTPNDTGGEASLVRYRVAAPVPERISWSGYLGTDFDATLPARR